MSGPLSIVAIGHVHAGNVAAITDHFAPVEQLVLDVAATADLDMHRGELNRAIDAAAADWLLLIREHEVVDPALAEEIAQAATPSPRAWGMRIRSIPYYAGKPLLIGTAAGELRLFHRRHLLRRGELNVQGTVVRLEQPLRSVTFATAAEHRQHLLKEGVPHSSLRRVLLFLRNVIGCGTLDRNTLMYLWIEAGFDQR